ncbi:hypothetical protein HU200_054541 [Digitaria exilis]|uniref:DUF4220 domain-containing protein n=1 Tax=Digitaria exilis TaxID=1010633 RepID=A0A835AVD6_9POAL|nr:hypothetical protein HU200_054541 [Digitaria exilis]
MAGTEQVVHVWKEWGIRAQVLLSLALQVTLLILAVFRRRVDSGVLRVFVWSAYQLADFIAIYVLSHMSVAATGGGSWPDEHELLVAFWTQFVLMHLGGQDNITAYAIEDNQLWLRHLQALAVQVATAAYVLYASPIFRSDGHSSWVLQVATILNFVAGAVKYGERVWALRYASSSSSSSPGNYGALDYRSLYKYVVIVPSTSRLAAEDILYLGHKMLEFPKGLLKGSATGNNRIKFLVRRDTGPQAYISHGFCLRLEEAYKVAEVQLSLMHDVLYTKAESQCGVIRVVTSVATAVALILLFPLLLTGTSSSSSTSSDRGYNKVDAAITFVLSVGACVLEATALVRHRLSSFNWFRDETRGIKTGLLPGATASFRRFVGAADRRSQHSWSRSMGQHSLLQVCVGSKVNRSSKVARRLGVEDWWNTIACSWSVAVSPLIERLVVKQVRESCGVLASSPDHISNSRGRAVLKRKSQQLYSELEWSVDPNQLSLEDTILVWHIATDLYLLQWRNNRKGSEDLAKAVEALSNYMLFLLVARPNMLPPSASRTAYVEMCYCLTAVSYSSAEELADLLRRYGVALNTRSESFRFPYDTGMTANRLRSLHNNTALQRGSWLATKLIAEDSPSSADTMLKLMGKVWVEILCYVGIRCSGYSHAKQLSDGGELVTVAAFLLEYLKRGVLTSDTTSISPDGPTILY